MTKITVILLLTLFTSLTTSTLNINAQTLKPNKLIKNYKKSLKDCTSFTCIREVDSTVQLSLQKENKKLIQIYLVRHARPEIHKPFFANTEKTAKYVKAYNSVDIQEFNANIIKTSLKPGHIIICSPIRRASQTAHKIFEDDYSYYTDSVYREFETKIIKAPDFIYMPTSFWQGISRFIWMLGGNDKGIENHNEAKKRATFAASQLDIAAQKEETAILIAHGMLNRSIKKKLHKNGWTVIQNKGKKNLGATILVRIE